MNLPVGGPTSTTPTNTVPLGELGAEAFLALLKREGLPVGTDPAQQQAYASAVQDLLRRMGALGGTSIPPALKQALLEAGSDPAKINPDAVLARVGQQSTGVSGTSATTFANSSVKVDSRIMSRGRNLDVYAQGPELSALAGGATIHVGHKGESVKEIQRMLNAMGAKPPLAVDGKFGPKTEAALKAFQESKGLAPNGILDTSTYEALKQGGTVPAELWDKYKPDYASDRGTAVRDRDEVRNERARPIDLSPLPGGEAGLLEQIARGEGTSDAAARAHGYTPGANNTKNDAGYEVTLSYGRYVPDKFKGRALTDMTVGEIKELQAGMLAHPENGWDSSAVGKYQIVGKTLRDLQRQMGFSDDQKFTPEFQDALGLRLAEGRGLRDFQSGRITAAEFQNNLSREWASVAAADTGRSHYGQNTGTSTSQIQNVIEGVRNA
jgi:peptidoglycan hydrolase-like protein with peptidoglycan-binding domain